METFNKLAGVQEASDTTEPSHPHPSISHESHPPPPPIPDDNNQQHASVPLPLNRRASHRSLRSKRSAANSRVTSRAPSITGQLSEENVPPVPGSVLPRPSGEDTAEEASFIDGEEGGEEDFPWGPSHPCFPHPNPHCHPKSEEAKTTRVIRVRRDWLASGDLYPQYANLYPEILETCVSDTEFRYLISNLNSILKRAFSPFTTRAWVDAILGVLTGYLWEDLGFTGAKRGERDLESFVERWNAERKADGRDVKLIGLRRTGFMCLDFVIGDPGIDGESETGEEAGGILNANGNGHGEMREVNGNGNVEMREVNGVAA